MLDTAIPEDIYNRIQEIFRATPALLIGSGFSCAYGLPHMGALGKHLVDNIEDNLISTSAKSLWKAALPAVKANLEQGLNTIPSGADGREELVEAIRQETSRHIINKTIEAEDKILLMKNLESLAPIRLLKRLFEGSPQNAECLPVITTNYDTLLELFCDIAGLPLDTGFSGLRRRRMRNPPIFSTQYLRTISAGKKAASYDHRPCLTIRLMKPHGSITWHPTSIGPIEILNDYNPGVRAIVVPGPSKYHDALTNILFDTVRSEMNFAISRASALLCVGFGFNDDHLQGVVKTRLDAHMPVIILARDFTNSIKEVILKYPRIIAFCSDGSGSECHHNGKITKSTAPLWDLDFFLQTFIE